MTTITFGDVTYKIKYGYKATMKSGILKRLVALNANETAIDQIETMSNLLPELLLAGLQKYHGEEFAYDYDTGEGKEEQIDKIYDLLDDYFDGEDSDFMALVNILQKELMENGFLAKMLRQEQEKQRGKKVLKTTASESVIPMPTEN